ncbi:MAG: hypothetical protein ACI9EF_001704 [Pseudohongiellaceae bacterium]
MWCPSVALINRREDTTVVPHTLRNGAAALLLLTSLNACSSLSGLFVEQEDESLRRVDTMLANIERVHVETVLARRRMADALESLSVIISPDFGGDALASYASFVDSIHSSEKQAAQLSASIEPMMQSAQAVFTDWTADLRDYRSEHMRDTSRERLDNTLDRYGELMTAIEPAQSGLELFNDVLRDHALFLGNDFNAASVTALEDNFSNLQRRVTMLDQQFISTQQAAKHYVQSAALRGQLTLTRTASIGQTVALSAAAGKTPQSASDIETNNDTSLALPPATVNGAPPPLGDDGIDG